jgi:hypothetical protein
MGGVRRSGRIKKEIGILLLGTDTSGRVFSEETVTVVLSLHGAGIVSRFKLAADEILTLRLLAGAGQEAEVRLIGQMGEESRGYTYGVAFVDDDLDFWKIEFPPPVRHENHAGLTLECTLCQERQFVDQTEIEADVFAISQSILHHCVNCGIVTAWRQAATAPAKSVVKRLAEKRQQAVPPPSAARSAPKPAESRHAISEASPYASSEIVPDWTAAGAGGEPEPSHSAYAGSPIEICSPTEPSWTPEENTDAVPAAIEASATAPVKAAVEVAARDAGRRPAPEREAAALSAALPKPAAAGIPDAPPKHVPADASHIPLQAPWDRASNRRRDVRTRVGFTACIRQGQAGDEIVECDNLSKGGLSFRSRKTYAVGSVVEVAAPYSPGSQAIFVAARIMHVELLPNGTLFRYGAMYAGKGS